MARTVKMVSQENEQDKEIQEDQPEAVSEAAIEEDNSSTDAELSDENQLDFDEGIAIESMDPSLEVWPGGPTVGQTIAWKDEFGEVYTTSLTMDFHVMWRPINRMEYKRHVKQMEQLSQSGKLSPIELNMYQEEALTEMCVLHPPYTRNDMSNELAGMPSIIAQQVMEASGFTALEVRQL